MIITVFCKQHKSIIDNWNFHLVFQRYIPDPTQEKVLKIEQLEVGCEINQIKIEILKHVINKNM